ncbi:NOG1 family protein [Pyrobaculum neutrophilum]|uniref:NOG1 family protein n=1 Tax=Pyrobaculum neutrophilum TaxID=70771 RepID=UPI0003251207|nr:NOG1 family protein [Pyrobaculum neutrophilum]
MEVVDKSKLPYVYTADELISMFLAAYEREEARGSVAEPAFVKQKRLEIKRIVSSGRAVASVLRRTALAMPFLDRLHPFYRDLMDVVFGAQSYKHAVAKVGNAHLAVRAIAKEAIAAVRTAPDKGAIHAARRMYRGRVVDLLNDLRPELDKLREVVAFLRRLPAVDPNLFTIVVAGAPNVGKSSFVRCVSSARPEVADYPFTTKQIHVGHIRIRGDVVQVVDTPGLLDRPLSERNAIERQAVLALRHLAGAIVFLVDPTPHSGFPLEMQLNLYREISASFQAPLVAVVNKVDIASPAELERARDLFSPIGEVSTLDCRGTGEVVNYVLAKFYVPAALERLRAARRS